MTKKTILKYPRRKKRKIRGTTFNIIAPDNQRSNIMSKIPSQRTSIEVTLMRELRKKKIKYRSGKYLYGKPDLIVFGHKIAIFCDGDFWHGYKNKNKKIAKTNSAFWKAKIERNIQRDKEVNRFLRKEGWRVIRLWEHQIKKNIDFCIRKINKQIER